jgi:hypothetical protein
MNKWWNVGASVRNNPSGSVTITLYENDTPVISATDIGVGCAAITHTGAVGIRGDNTRFWFDSFKVTSL